MALRKILRIGAISAAAFLATNAAQSAQAQTSQAQTSQAQTSQASASDNAYGTSPATTGTPTERGHVFGKDEAPVKLIEFISYTCSFCKIFTNEGEPSLQLGYIASGKVQLDLRSFIRNDLDLTATMLVQCGDRRNFLSNHTTFMINQPTWLGIAKNTTQAQRNRWMVKDRAAARRAIASDLGFYGLMELRGYQRTTLDACLNNEKEAKRLQNNTERDALEFGIAGTPSFAINGKTLAEVHNWPALEQVLKSKFPDKPTDELW